MADTDAIVEVKAPAVPEACHCAIVQGAIVERRTNVRAHIFQGIKLPIVPKNSHIAFANLKFSSATFRDILNTGQTDCL